MKSTVATQTPATFTFVLALWLALGTALIELAVRVAVWQFTVRPFESGIHIVWMAPLMNLIWFGCAAIAAWIAMRLWPRRVPARAVVGFLFFPAFLSILWLYTKIHWIAMIALALGLAVQAAWLLEPRLEALLRFNRRAALISVSLTLLLVSVALGVHRWREWVEMRALPDGPSGAPNVLLLVLDTVRSFSMSAYGYGQPTTPTIERLASEGVRFDRAFATSGWTLPSHSSIFTGRYADELLTGPGAPLPDHVPTLAEVMAAEGYATGGFVANLKYTTWEHGVARGFIRYQDYPVTALTLLNASSIGRRIFAAQSVRNLVGYHDDPDRKNAARIQREFLAWIDGVDHRPFFAFLNYFDAHHPYLPPAPYDTLFGPELPPRYRPHSPEFGELSSQEIALASNGYRGAIAYIDEQIGKLTNELQRRGLLDNTFIIITSDHGEHLGDHNLMGHGNSSYRQLLQVPLIMRFPKLLPEARVVTATVSLRDLSATVLDVADIARKGDLPGNSLLPIVTGSTAVVSAAVSGRVLIQTAQAQSLVSDSMHYIRRVDGIEELYDLENDSLETHSLVSSPAGAALLPRLRARLDSISAAAPPANR